MDPFAPGFLQRLDEPPRRVAIFGAFPIGDFLCATPGLRSLRAALPQAEFTFIGLPVTEGLAKRNPSIDRFEAFPGFPGIAEQWFDARDCVDFLRRMQDHTFDLAIQLHGSGACSNVATLLLGAKRNAGFVRPGDRAGLLDAALALPESEHATRRALRLAVFLGAEPQGYQTDLSLTADDRQCAEARLAGRPRPWIGLHPGAGDPEKIWPTRNFAAFGSLFLNTGPATIITIGGPGEGEAGSAIAAELKSDVLDLSAKLSVPEMAAVVGCLDLLVTNDSGPAHMAYALGTPSVTLFGDTDPAIWGPTDESRHQVVLGRNRSVALISPLEVFTAGHALVTPALAGP
jgi:ADP-heptose:LPS heptosyltransferase